MFFPWHIFLVTKVTHPFVTLDREIATLPVPVGIRGVTHKPKQRAPWHETIHAFRLCDFGWKVAMEELLSSQKYSPGVQGDLGDDQSKVLEKMTMKSA